MTERGRQSAGRCGGAARRRGQGGPGVNSAPQNSISAVPFLSFKVSVQTYELVTAAASEDTMRAVRGHVHMTSVKFSHFLTPSPLVCIFTQSPLLSFLTASPFGVPPSPLPVQTSYVHAP